MPSKTVKKSIDSKMTGRPPASTGGDITCQLECSELLNALPFYVLLVDEHHHIVMANRAVTEHLGMKPEDIIGRYCPEAIHGTKEPWYACPLEESVKTNAAVVREAQDQKTGHWINSAIYPIPDISGRKVFFHMVTDITDRKTAEEQLKISREQLRELSHHLETVREEERSSIAREIHDELGQTLVTLKVYISWFLRHIPHADDLASDQTAAMYSLIDTAIKTVMRLSTELRPGVLDDLGLAAAIEWQINEFKKWTELDYHFSSNLRRITFDRDTSTALYRIAHEALTNVIRHAGATRVDISLRKTTGTVKLSISDNGKGISESQVNDLRAFGLLGMRERAHLLGGELTIHGEPGKGTRLELTMPFTKGTGGSGELA